jgi:hypothetical protein
MGGIESEVELLAYQQDLELGRRMVERSRQESLSRRGKKIVIEQVTEYSPEARRKPSDDNNLRIIEGVITGVGVNSEMGTTATQVLYYEGSSLMDPQVQPLELVQAA